MPGLHITDHQMRLYMSARQSHDTAIAAAKAGFSTATGYRLHALQTVPPKPGLVAVAGSNGLVARRVSGLARLWHAIPPLVWRGGAASGNACAIAASPIMIEF